MFPMTLWVYCNPQEAPSEHSCPSENPDKGGIRIVRFLIEFELVHCNHQEAPSGHSCPQQLHLGTGFGGISGMSNLNNFCSL